MRAEATAWHIRQCMVLKDSSVEFPSGVTTFFDALWGSGLGLIDRERKYQPSALTGQLLRELPLFFFVIA